MPFADGKINMVVTERYATSRPRRNGRQIIVIALRRFVIRFHFLRLLSSITLSTLPPPPPLRHAAIFLRFRLRLLIEAARRKCGVRGMR